MDYAVFIDPQVWVALFSEPATWFALLTLTAMEVVLGIDNIVFLSIVTNKLPEQERPRARRIGLSLALILRIGLLVAITWVMGLTEPVVEVYERTFSGRDLILGIGGLFLLAKATHEIFETLEFPDGDEQVLRASKAAAFGSVVLQIAILDIVFSLDSVITAVGMAKHLQVMVVAVVISIIIMMIFAGAIGNFIHRYPSMKVLALSFLIMIGVMLVAEALGQHINKGYIYFAMAFSLGVEVLSLGLRGGGGARSRDRGDLGTDPPQ